ncbi:MAG: hypothetical protein RR416_02895 [Clostridia bacterium]
MDEFKNEKNCDYLDWEARSEVKFRIAVEKLIASAKDNTMEEKLIFEISNIFKPTVDEMEAAYVAIKNSGIQILDYYIVDEEIDLDNCDFGPMDFNFKMYQKEIGQVATLNAANASMSRAKQL